MRAPALDVLDGELLRRDEDLGEVADAAVEEYREERARPRLALEHLVEDLEDVPDRLDVRLLREEPGIDL